MKRLTDFMTLCSPLLPVVILAIAYGYAPESLIFDRTAVQQGELWRLITAHFVHCDFEHLLFNIVGVLALVFVFNKLNLSEILLAMIVGIIIVDIWIWFGMDQLDLYCGLSALENSILVMGLLTYWRRGHKLIAFCFGGLTIGKITIEIIQNNALFTHISWLPVPETHAAGFIGGCLAILLMEWFKRNNKQRRPLLQLMPLSVLLVIFCVFLAESIF